MLNVTELSYELQEQTEWQETPKPLTRQDYERMIIKGIRKLYISTGRALEYDDTMLVYNTYDDELEGTDTWFNATFPLDEIAYIMICSQIEFFKKVQSDVNTSFGYQTNALTVTNADKPYANLKDTIEKLENDRRELFYRMTRYTMGD